MERQEVLSGFAAVAADQLGITSDQVVEEASFADDLGLDSLDLVEFVMAIEESFDVKIADDELKNVLTVGQAVDLVVAKQAAAAAAGAAEAGAEAQAQAEPAESGAAG